MGHTFYRMTKAKDKVEFLLTEFPHLRDSDERTIASFWYWELGADNIENMSAKELLQAYVDGRLTSAETIRRCRQKLQEQKVELRGSNYVVRKEEGDEFNHEVHDL